MNEILVVTVNDIALVQLFIVLKRVVRNELDIYVLFYNT